MELTNEGEADEDVDDEDDDARLCETEDDPVSDLNELVHPFVLSQIGPPQFLTASGRFEQKEPRPQSLSWAQRLLHELDCVQ